MTTLIDSSAWIEYLRASGGPANRRVRQLLADELPIATTDVVFMELLAGAGTPGAARDIGRLLNRATHLPVRPLFDYEAAASIYRTCRRGGFTPPQLADCLVAAVALHNGAAVLHHDRDFERIAEHTGRVVDELDV